MPFTLTLIGRPYLTVIVELSEAEVGAGLTRSWLPVLMLSEASAAPTVAANVCTLLPAVHRDADRLLEGHVGGHAAKQRGEHEALYGLRPS